MEYRTLARTGLKVSALGLGTWAMGGDEWGPSDDAQSRRVLNAAVEAGVTLIDTADVYGAGHSEELVGQAISPDWNGTIVTKVGWDIYTEPRVVGGSRRRYDAGYIERAFTESLRRLRRERLDVYLLHNPARADLEDGEGLRTLRALKQKGVVNWIGASVGSEDDARAAIEADIDVLEVPFNVVRSWARALAADVEAAGTGIIAREPLERGLLTGKYGPGAQFPPGDHRAEKGADWLQAAQPHAERVRAVAERLGVSSADVALAYPLSYAHVATTIVGARSVEQLNANVSGAAVKLSDADRAALEAAD